MVSPAMSFEPRAKPASVSHSEKHAWPEERHAQAIYQLTRQFIFDDATAEDVGRRVEKLQKQSNEKEREELQVLMHFLEAVEDHEEADLYHAGAWQAVLMRQPAHGRKQPKPPETLSREEVAKEFEAFRFRGQMEIDEESALKRYQLVLDSGMSEFKTSQNTKVMREDIEMLLNDLQVRVAERIPDEKERKTRLRDLDKALRELIERIPDEEFGKRFELEEIYLLRSLIHAADTGHLASVSHGTPREDLRPDRGSIDIRMTAAGDTFKFQLKTFKRGVSATTREVQERALERAHYNMRDPATHLIILEAERIKEAYEKSLRQAGRGQTSRADKYQALQPLTDVVSAEEHQRMVALLGLTEKDFRAEQKVFDEKVDARKELEGVMWAQREVARLSQQEMDEAFEQAKLKHQREEQEKKDALIEQQRQAVEAAQRARDALAQAKEETAAQRQQRRQEEKQALARRIAEREEEERLQLEELKKKEERRMKREQKERETADWPPKALTSLGNVTVLKNLGLLHEDWNDDVRLFLDAKREFVRLFGKPKKKDAPATEADKPNAFFAEMFPNKQSLESPTGDDIHRWRATLKKE